MWWRVCSSAAAALRRLRRDRRGVTVIEFAVLGLMFFVLLFGAIDIGRYQITVQSLRSAAAEAARAALVATDPAVSGCPVPAIDQGAVKARTPFLLPASLDFAIARACPSFSEITVTATYPFRFFAPILASPAMTLTETTVLRF